VNIDTVPILHKTAGTGRLDIARQWLQEMIDDGFPEGKWFIVKDIIQINSYKVE
jgi:hypothetical protein